MPYLKWLPTGEMFRVSKSPPFIGPQPNDEFETVHVLPALFEPEC